MNGFNVTEGGHVVNVLAPVSISGGKTGQRFSMKNHEHCSLIIQIGSIGSNLPTAILIKQCTDSSGTGATAIAYRYSFCLNGSTAQDLTSPPTYVAATGILQAAMSKINSQFIIIELDGAELADGSPWVEWSVTDSGNVTLMSAVAILSGNRFASAGGGVTATT